MLKCFECIGDAIKSDSFPVFIGGVIFGSLGLKALASKDAKRAYVHGTAAALRVKDFVMDTTAIVQENAEDILAEAKEINAKRAAEEEWNCVECENIDVAEAE
ncbi:MAG: DUF6110 family protein [Bacillota bacterium]|nr:DUF6110 family protein [Bacillota bacterium]